MEYNKHEIEILKLIESHKIMRFNHIFVFYKAISRATAYNYGLDKLDSIKNALELNRHNGVNYLLQKWIASNNPTLQIAAMRLICESEDHKRLNQSYIDHTTKGQKVGLFHDWTDEQIENELQRLKDK